MPRDPYNLHQTSGAFLLEVLRRRAEADDAPAADVRRYEIACDVYIKQWSYAVLNKVFFWLALAATLAVLVWPVLLATLKSLEGLQLVTSAITQAMVTAVAAFFVGLYLHYKARQTSAETLLRSIAFGDQPPDKLAELVNQELSRIDQGVRFRTQAKEDGE
ncbi:MAG: hypothetical protein KDC18_10315 [Alphaproteobacteria bacterium]|nr:hypothetical protein [Alphaproteobacteria bacterium]MCB9930914.1 hypothetical protein [Alphaproteobacteria bacterium]